MTTSEEHRAAMLAALKTAAEAVSYATFQAEKGPPMHATPEMRKAVAALTEAMCCAGSCAAVGMIEESERKA